jgi:hypothetical protein
MLFAISYVTLQVGRNVAAASLLGRGQPFSLPSSIERSEEGFISRRRSRRTGSRRQGRRDRRSSQRPR